MSTLRSENLCIAQNLGLFVQASSYTVIILDTIIVVAEQFSKLVRLVPLRRIRSVYVDQTLLEHWNYKFDPPKALLLGNEKQYAP